MEKIYLTTMIGAFLFLAGSAAVMDSPTYDEPHHLKYGARILDGDSNQYQIAYSPFASHMPFSALNAIPKKLFSTPWPFDIFQGRFVTIFFSVLTALFVYRWANELYGLWPARLSLFAYLFDPNILAHSHLVTTDVYALGMITISAYFIWRFSKKPTLSRAWLAACIVAISQLAKYSSLFAYPIILLIGALRLRERKRWAQLFIFSVFVSWVVINMAYFFNSAFLPLKKYDFKSSAFMSLQEAFPNAISPLPGPYLNGLDTQLHNQETGEAFGNLYLLGELRETIPGYEGFKWYFLVVAFFKTPIALQLLMVWALVACWRRKKKKFLENEVFLAVPVVLFAVYFSLFFKMQVGLRYFLVVFPFIYIFCGSLLAGREALSKGRKAVAGFLAGWLLLSNLSYFPHTLSYCNEWVWNRLHAYKLFADSNLDWGQDWMRMKAYLNAHPEAIYSPERPTAGKIVVRLNDLVGIYDVERFRWLRENFSPSGRIAYSFLIFDIRESDLKHL